MSRWGDVALAGAATNPDIRILSEPTPDRGRTEDHRHLSEHEEQVALFLWAEDNFLWAEDNVERLPQLSLMFAIPNGGQRHAAVAGKLKAEGVRAGVPDIFLAYPNRGMTGLFIELKVKGNKPSNSQQLWLQRLGNAGCAVALCYGADEAITILEEYIS